MKTSQAGIDLIRKFEGCRLKSYRDAAGVWTIGYGTTTAAGQGPIGQGMTITQERANEMLVNALATYEAAVSKALTRSPTQHQFDAMVSLAYNIGAGAFSLSTVRKKFNSGDIAGAGAAFRMWVKADGNTLPGLITRREAEIQHFWTADDEQPVPAPTIPPAPETPSAIPAAPAKPLWTLGRAVALLVAAIAAAVGYLLSKGA